MMAQDVILTSARKHTSQQRENCTFALYTSSVVCCGLGQGLLGDKSLMKILDILIAMTFRNKHDLTQEQNKSLTLSSLSGHTELDLDMCAVLDLLRLCDKL